METQSVEVGQRAYLELACLGIKRLPTLTGKAQILSSRTDARLLARNVQKLNCGMQHPNTVGPSPACARANEEGLLQPFLRGLGHIGECWS
jgi:hypothetical protein